MNKKRSHLTNTTALLSLLLCFLYFITPANAQSTSAQNNKVFSDNDITRGQLARFDQFLDSHPEIAEQVRKNPSLLNDRQFVEKHPALQTYLQQQPGIREEIRENPNAFMRQENNFDRREDRRDNDVSRGQLARFDQFLDSHREIAEQVRRDPSLLNNKEFVEKHPALQTYLQQQPAIREEIRENPNAFMRQENNFDRREDRRDNDVNRSRDFDASRDRDNDVNRGRDNDVNRDRDNDANRGRDNDANRGRDNDANRGQAARFDQFLDSHREIAEQVRKDPSLLNNKDFVDKHPALQTYLQQQPGVRAEIRENPNAFMRQQNSFDHREDQNATRGQASFRAFLGGHSDIAQDLSKNPSMVKNQEYVENHPELKEYMKAHPDVHAELMKNPESMVKPGQQPDKNSVETPKPPAPKPQNPDTTIKPTTQHDKSSVETPKFPAPKPQPTTGGTVQSPPVDAKPKQ